MKHPLSCYTYIEAKDKVGIIRWGKCGFIDTNFGPGYSKEAVFKINEMNFGISKQETLLFEKLSKKTEYDGNEDMWFNAWITVVEEGEE